MSTRDDHSKRISADELVLGPAGRKAIAAILDAAVAARARVTPELRAAIREYIAVIKAEGLQCEHAVILLNRTMDAEGIRALDDDRVQIRNAVVKLRIEEFYHSDE